jgi:hypothetical protein
VRDFSDAASASFHPADFPAAFSSSGVRLTVLRSFSHVSCPWLLARPELRSSSVGPARAHTTAPAPSPC